MSFKKLPLVLVLAVLIGAWQLGCESDRPIMEGSFLSSDETEGVDFRNFAQDLELMSDICSRSIAQTRSDELATKLAADNELRLMAEVMVMDHKKSHDRLLAILDRHEMAVTTRTIPSIEGRVKDLTSNGARFDSAYLALVVSEHEGYVRDLEEMHREMSDEECRQWIAQSILLNRSHMRQAQQLLESRVPQTVVSN